MKGRLLLDGGSLEGSFFRRTVVLVCEHNAEGAFGLVLNRPSKRRLEDALREDVPETLRGQALFVGGPVQPAALSFLFRPPDGIHGSVLPKLSVGHEVDALVALGEAGLMPGRLRVFAGYAGWSPGQLDDEIRRGSWLVHAASADFLMETPPGQLWRRILKTRDAWEERILADAPEDLSRN